MWSADRGRNEMIPGVVRQAPLLFFLFWFVAVVLIVVISHQTNKEANDRKNDYIKTLKDQNKVLLDRNAQLRKNEAQR